MPTASPRFSLCLLALLLTLAAAGQSNMKERDRRELASVQSLVALHKLEEAEAGLDKLLKKYPEVAELHYLSGEIHQYQHDYPAAIAALDRGIQLDNGRSYRAYLMLGEAHTLAGNYPEALENYESYLRALQGLGRASAIARAEGLVAQAKTVAGLAANPYPFTPEPLGSGINTTESLEYFPSLSIDGNRMLFTRRVDRRQEDFYQSERQADGSWGVAVPLGGVNTARNEGAQTITADGNYLIFTGCGRPGGLGSCDLYFSERIGERWSDARNLGESINTRASESQPSLSKDGKLLFFASNREGGLGNDDLYVAGRRPDGSWSRPVNLGPAVNTSGNDRYPFWAADNKTLYFTSNGRAGMGGADLFRTSVDSSNQWESPVNLGYPINTPGEETNLFVALDGKTAFFSKGIGDDVDIYTFELPERVRPAPATYVQVTVVDDQTGRPLTAAVRLQPQRAGGRVTANQTDRFGQYVTVLPTGVDYGFSVDKSGYIFYSDRFLLAGEYTASDPYELLIRLQPVGKETVAEAAGEDGAIVLQNVFFETGSADLLPLSTEELDRLVSLLREQDGVRVEIAGHTDDVGATEANQDLSEHRAASVKAYLVEQDIPAERITAVGYGESRPVGPNDTEEGRARNRRTTFRLLF